MAEKRTSPDLRWIDLDRQENISHAIHEAGNHSFYGAIDAFAVNRYYNVHQALTVTALTLCSLGIAGNVLSMVVLTRPGMKSTTYTFLTALSVSDITVLVATILIICLSSFVPPNSEILIETTYLPYIYPVIQTAFTTCLTTGIWLTVALTADRYIAIRHAMFTNKLCTISRARKAIAGIFTIGILYNFPLLFQYTIVRVFLPRYNQTVALYTDSEFGKSLIMKQFYFWANLVFLWVIPFCTLLFMNGFLIHTVRSAKAKSRELGQEEPKGVDVTVMLIAVVVMFFIGQCPQFSTTLVYTFNPSLFKTVSFQIYSIVASFLLIVSASMNFLIYSFFGKKFRRKFLSLILAHGKYGRSLYWSTGHNGARDSLTPAPASPYINTRLLSNNNEEQQNGINNHLEYREQAVTTV